MPMIETQLSGQVHDLSLPLPGMVRTTSCYIRWATCAFETHGGLMQRSSFPQPIFVARAGPGILVIAIARQEVHLRHWIRPILQQRHVSNPNESLQKMFDDCGLEACVDNVFLD